MHVLWFRRNGSKDRGTIPKGERIMASVNCDRCGKKVGETDDETGEPTRNPALNEQLKPFKWTRRVQENGKRVTLDFEGLACVTCRSGVA